MPPAMLALQREGGGRLDQSKVECSRVLLFSLEVCNTPESSQSSNIIVVRKMDLYLPFHACQIQLAPSQVHAAPIHLPTCYSYYPCARVRLHDDSGDLFSDRRSLICAKSSETVILITLIFVFHRHFRFRFSPSFGSTARTCDGGMWACGMDTRVVLATNSPQQVRHCSVTRMPGAESFDACSFCGKFRLQRESLPSGRSLLVKLGLLLGKQDI